MTEQNTTAKTDGSITTYCIEHAKTQQSKCAACEKTIPHKSLRVAEIFRKSKKVKKDLAKHTWYHFKCFKVPELLVRVPIEQFRGYPALNDKDKARVQRVIQSGVGSSWADLMEKSKPVKTEEELEADKEEQAKKDKKKKEDEDSMDMDMTANLTGTQQKPKSKANKKPVPASPSSDSKKASTTEQKNKKALKAKTDKKSKVTKNKANAAATVAAPVKEVKLPKEDLDELQNFAKEFMAFK
ncbi:hypothetical protein V8B55DRAFT_1507952 [Mucor lusitanicus]|uniref:PARP-type domain-containing protein n=2 Tax=Mucor circinelloides f. lusitanicus TaxID=29924 RepID=A0A168PZ48_MUCCL|nr:hypothetical protein FB192DRAFT_1421413 [Mucor lusitanicus]OAD08448.1 hypothetical protein MUCCIDRAFT_158656 [Mucor lusitanicus CBS 277.49]